MLLKKWCVFVLSGFYHVYLLNVSLVLKRCISGLPPTECPFIPKRTLELARSRRVRSIDHNVTVSALVKRSPIQFPDSLSPLNQKAVDEPACDERRLLGVSILQEKGEYTDSMLSRFVGNFIIIFTNQTLAQEVSRSGSALAK